MKKIIGITGGIGSGKSFVSRIIEKMGYPVFYADQASKWLTNNDPEVKKKLIQLLGNEVYLEGTLNIPFLSKIVFSSDAKREQINQIIHPVVRRYFTEWVESQSVELCFNEAAILFETGAYKNFDGIILVTAPDDLRIKRVMERDKCSMEEVQARMKKQWPDEKKRTFQPLEIMNDESQALLIQIETAIKELKK